MTNTIVWFRLDLRLADNPALVAAAGEGGAVIPLFIHAPEEEEPWAPGAASRWWLHYSLQQLDDKLRQRGLKLVIRRGSSLEALSRLIKETSARAVFWNRRYEPAIIARDKELTTALQAQGVRVGTHNAALLHEPESIRNQTGGPYKVFSAFWRSCLTQAESSKPLPEPKRLNPIGKEPKSLVLDELELLPKINWAAGLGAAWAPGERGAAANLRQFVAESFDSYSELRNRPDLRGTSRLSPHLHFGEISPRQVWHGLAAMAAKRGLATGHWRNSQFAAELGWREFAHHLLVHFPKTPSEPLRPEFKNFPWHDQRELVTAWQKGRTGFPMVDAGMRELWATGWMHNRVRMIVASFLVKDLLVSWQEGARWFWDCLVDADLAQNTLGWQWTAGCGADAAPFFRVFNPVSQGEKFDPRGNYVRQWCPELAGLPDRWVHRPGLAPREVLQKAGITLGANYPSPIVNHTIARVTALDAFARIKA